MFDLSELNAAKKKAVINKGKFNDKFEQVQKEALDIFNTFLENNDPKYLTNSMLKFNQAIELKPSDPLAYFHLSLGFYMIGNHQLAKKYILIVENLNSDYPNLDNFIDLLEE